MRIKSEYILLCFIILIAGGVRIIAFCNTEHYEGDSINRITGAYRLASYPFNLSQYWEETKVSSGQLSYLFLNTFFMRFLDEPILISRIITFIFGISMIFPYYLLIKSAFSQDIALISVLALSFYYNHILYSVASLAVAECLFFIILAIYFLMQYLYKYDNKNKKAYLISSIVFTILATSFRLDAWPLVVFLPFLFLKERKLKEALIFFVFSSFYIITTLYLQYKTSGNLFLYSLRTSCLPNQGVPFMPSSLFRRLLSGFFITRPDMPSYGKYQIFIWLNTLFYTFSSLLSLLGFFGMVNAFRNKKQYIFFMNFWSFFILLTLRQVISNHYPDVRYSYILGIFFIPFIFLGVANVITYIRRLFGLGDFYKRKLVIITSLIINIYFIFVSVNFFIKELLPRMKYGFFIRSLTSWVGKNINSGDIIIFPPYNSELHTAELENKFIGIDYNIGNLLALPKGNIEYKPDKGIINEMQDFIRKKHIVGVVTGECVSRLLIKRGDSQRPQRIMLVLDKSFYDFLKDEHPGFLKKVKIKYDGLLYSAILWSL